jgi:hypothetical protein
MLPNDIKPTEEHIPVTDMIHDVEVNPRIPSDSWRRKHVDGYNRALLGLFTLSERLREDGSRELAILDGANRAELMKMADDAAYPVLCNVFHGLEKPQEAELARRFNDRRAWTSIRTFQAQVTEGDPIAVALSSIAGKEGWIIDTASGLGVLRGIAPFYRLITAAGIYNATQAGVSRGSARWQAALESGKADALRVLEQSINVYTQAFPERPGSYAADIMYGISLVFLKHGMKVSPERMTTQLRTESGGQTFVISEALGIRKTMKLTTWDALAFYMIRCYNKGLQGASKAKLDDPWLGLYKN